MHGLPVHLGIGRIGFSLLVAERANSGSAQVWIGVDRGKNCFVPAAGEPLKKLAIKSVFTVVVPTGCKSGARRTDSMQGYFE